MLFTHDGFKSEGGAFFVGEKVEAKASGMLDNAEFAEIWKGYACGHSEIEITASHSEKEGSFFSIGGAKGDLEPGADYTVKISENGVYIAAANDKSLAYGFFTLIDMLELSDEGECFLPCGTLSERALTAFRAIHLCVFPETELSFLRRTLRLCAALKYTHVVLEFWGMIKYDCLSALSWKNAFSKEEVRPIIREANALGLEIIPMLNHWGHATSGRLNQGKHVVLDQEPSLSYLFDCEGWCWRIKSERVKKLLSEMRSELIELCGEGEYFHIGCDEAYGFIYTDESVKEISSYINSVADELEAKGRKTIMWADMLLSKHEEYNAKNKYTAAAPSLEFENAMISAISKKIIMADWQYTTPSCPVETAVTLKSSGFDVLLCPYDISVNVTNATVKTASEHSLSGIMHTTWHTLSSGMYYVGLCADVLWSGEKTGAELEIVYKNKIAAALRKAAPSDGAYENAGWAKIQVGTRWI